MRIHQITDTKLRCNGFSKQATIMIQNAKLQGRKMKNTLNGLRQKYSEFLE